MKYKKLKPILTGSVFLLPTLLLLNGQGQKTDAMLRAPLSKLPSINRINLPSMQNLNKPTLNKLTLNKPTFNAKLNQIKLPNSTSKIDVKPGTPHKPFYKTYSLKTGQTLKKPIQNIFKSNSFGGKLNYTQKNNQNSTQAPDLKPRQPLTQTQNPETNFQKLDPGYDKVPKPIFTPRDPNKGVPEPEVYENVVILNTNAGTLTIFKD